ncbi:MAG: ADP-ribosylation/crystallin J1 [Planctomycetota bacterium]
MRLYRPVGIVELELIATSGWTAYPPRLDHQPIFYPVLSYKYAEAIAKNWNTKDPNSGFAGFVTEFDVDDLFVARYPAHIVGSREDQELWVPAEDLSDFNNKIIGPIIVTGHYYGESFSGTIDSATNLPLSVLAANRFK